MTKILKVNPSLKIDVDSSKIVKHCGFGSSSSTITAVAVAINELYGCPISNKDLIKFLASNHGEEISDENEEELMRIEEENLWKFKKTGEEYAEKIAYNLLHKALPELCNGNVVIDESAIEFSDKSSLSKIETPDNIIVIKSLSKAYGIAGLRIGYMTCSKKFKKYMKKI